MIVYVDVDPAVAVAAVGTAKREKSATVCVKTGEVLPAKVASPLYTAVIERAPAASAEIGFGPELRREV